MCHSATMKSPRLHLIVAGLISVTVCIAVVGLTASTASSDTGTQRAGAPILVQSTDLSVTLTPQLTYFEDESATLELSAIQDAFANGQFVPEPKGEFSKGFSGSAFWAHGVLENRTEDKSWYFIVDYPLLDNVDFYLKRRDGRIERETTGESLPHRNRPLDTRLFVFPIVLHPGEVVDIFVRVQTDGACQTQFELWPTEAYLESESQVSYWLGVYYGGLLILAFYNILLFFYFRRMAFLALATMVFMSAAWLATLDGFIYQHLWPNSPAWNAQAASTCLIALTTTGFALSRMFLEELLPAWINRLIDLLTAASVAILVAGLFLPYNVGIRLAMGMMLIYFPSNLVFASLALKSGETRARSFFISAVFLTVCGLLTTGYIVGWVQALPMARYAAPLGVAVMAALLSVSLSDEIGAVKRTGESLKASFSKFVPSTLVGQLVASGQAPQLGGQERDATILFSDLRGYSTIVEHADPVRVVELLCEYFDAMTRIVRAHEGNVLEYVGDAILAVFGAPSDVPDHAAKATACALEMCEMLGDLNDEWDDRSISMVWQEAGFDDLSARIGIHTGRVVAGNMGSRDTMRYGAVGDPVNVAARLEALNKELDTTILISAEVYAALPPHLAKRAVDAGSHALKGRARPQKVYTFNS